jgi:ABC-type phosphate transport system substrate-binding protein
MGRNKAMFISGLVTALLMMVVVGLAGSAGWFRSRSGEAAPPSEAAIQTADPGAADSATLRQQVSEYRQQLSQAYTDLQTAYDQIGQLQRAIGAQNAQRSRQGGFRNGGFDRDNQQRNANPFDD